MPQKKCKSYFLGSLVINTIKKQKALGGLTMSRKNDKSGWQEPRDKTQWLLDLIDISEAAVKTYEKYLLDKANHDDLSRVMICLRKLLPMSIEDKYKDD